MTPAARISAAIEVLDRYLAGEPAEKALTNWARANRYAGSKDRAAVRDHVFDAVRRLRSAAALGGSRSGRGLMIGLSRLAGQDVSAVFSGEGYGPATLTDAEKAHLEASVDLLDDAVVDCPEWLWPMVQADLGAQAGPVFAAQQDRAPVFARVNTVLVSPDQVIDRLAEEGIGAATHQRQPSAITITQNPRRLQQSACFKEGWIELQDASSQAIADFVPLAPGARVLDLCAGGGGKTLAMAAREPQAKFFAHDIDPRRLAPLAERAARAKAKVTLLGSDQLSAQAPFDVVLCDVPCSGSGAWRRSPEGKWALTSERLADLCATQARILGQGAKLARSGGELVYATCSILASENANQIKGFIEQNANWSAAQTIQFLPDELGDGLFAQRLTKPA